MPINESDLWDLTARSEAAYLDLVSDDANSGFILRICRYPELETAWTWLHIFHHDHVHNYTHHQAGCHSTPVDETSDTAIYQADNDFELVRQGDRLDPEMVEARVEALLHSGFDFEQGDGILPATLRARFTGLHSGVQNLAGRSEVLGNTVARLTIGDNDIELDGHGHFHEQIQDLPRFTEPFTYASLRGDNAGMIFIRGAKGAQGSLMLGEQQETIRRVRIEAPASVRRFEIETDQRKISGTAIATYQYDLPLFHRVRNGAIVTAELDGHALSGCINDLVFGELGFDHF